MKRQVRNSAWWSTARFHLKDLRAAIQDMGDTFYTADFDEAGETLTIVYGESYEDGRMYRVVFDLSGHEPTQIERQPLTGEEISQLTPSV